MPGVIEVSEVIMKISEIKIVKCVLSISNIGGNFRQFEEANQLPRPGSRGS